MEEWFEGGLRWRSRGRKEGRAILMLGVEDENVESHLDKIRQEQSEHFQNKVQHCKERLYFYRAYAADILMPASAQWKYTNKVVKNHKTQTLSIPYLTG